MEIVRSAQHDYLNCQFEIYPGNRVGKGRSNYIFTNFFIPDRPPVVRM
jgi:hypothetical protein